MDPSRRSLLPKLRDWLRRIRRPGATGDPYADRLVPVRRGPTGRSGGAAVAEPDEGEDLSFPPRS